LDGVYFFADGQINIQGNTTIQNPPGKAATLILLPPKFVNSSDPGASLNITGTPSIQLTAQSTVASTQVPSALSSVQSLMTDLLIYDPETTKNQTPVKVSGDSNSYFNGLVYVPNSPVTYGGNSSVSSPGCFMVIAYAVKFSGNTNLDD